jgi:kinesin family protein 13
LNCPKSTPNTTNTSADQQKDRPMDYEFARQQFMMKEKINDLIQGAIKALQEKHELDKNNASDEQKQNYEKQLKKLASFLSPGTPYLLYSLNNVFDSYERNGSSTNSTSPNSAASKMEKWAQERDELFKKSLTMLRVDIVGTKTLAYEVNHLADQMEKCTEFKVTLQIPAAYLSPNRRRRVFVSEPVILVKRKNRASQIWSMEKFESIEMREL